MYRCTRCEIIVDDFTNVNGLPICEDSAGPHGHHFWRPYDPSIHPTPAPGVVYDSPRVHETGEPLDNVRTFNGVTSTKLPRYELIPKSALDSLALRLELGVQRKGDGAWNALNNKRYAALENPDFVIERLSHVIHHCMDAIAKIARGNILNGEDDAGAILFGGAVLAEYKKMLQEYHPDSDPIKEDEVK